MNDWTNRPATRPAVYRCAHGLVAIAAAVAVVATPHVARADVSAMLGFNARARAVAIQPDGKIVTVGESYSNNGPTVDEQGRDLVLTRTNVDGSADTTFGVLGVVVMDLGSDFEGLTDVSIQPDGRILAGGAANGTFVLVRLETDGSLDAGFGSGGFVTGGDDFAIQADGRIVTADGGFISRFLPDGTLDSSFGTGGEALIGYFIATDLEIQTDGKIVLGGFEVPSFQLKTVRLESDGSVDTLYGSGGTSIIAGNYRPGDLAIDTSGRILLSAYVEADPDWDYPAVARFLADGTPDATFGDDGLVAFPELASSPYLSTAQSDIALQSDGKILVSGDCRETFLLFRMNDDGSLDPTFDGDGVRQTDLGGFPGINHDGGACALALTAGDEAVSVGFWEHGTNFNLAAVRTTTSGALDTEFDGDGFLVESDCRRFPLPVPACRPASRSKLRFTGGGPDQRSSLSWSWGSPDGFAHTELGAPGTETRFTVCFYDMSAGIPRLATWFDLYGDPAGWKEDAPKGWQYRDGGPDTIETMRLKAGAGTGSSKASMRADGYTVPLPQPVSIESWFNKDPSVLVQLVSTDGLCLQSEFPVESVKRDDGEAFKAVAR